jgi:hypothetical protein
MPAKPAQLQPAVSTAPQHDIAISFLAADQPFAGELANRLSETLEIFYYPRSQGQVAGTDGMESMRFIDAPQDHP